MKQYNEQTSGQVTITFRDAAGALAAPASATYRIDCLTTGSVVRASTALGAGSSVTINLTSTDTAIVQTANQYEIKSITVVGIYGAGDQVTQDVQYAVKNLRSV